MTKELAYGPNGTAVEGVASLAVPISVLNYDLDFKVVSHNAGEIVYTDITSPTDQPSTLRIAQKERANVYAGTSIDPSVMLPSRKGTDIVIEVREVWGVSDTTDPSYLLQFPVRCAITLNVPTTTYVGKDQVIDLVGRVIAGMYEQGAVVGVGIEAMLRGALEKE